jgi:hypothetical protein
MLKNLLISTWGHDKKEGMLTLASGMKVRLAKNNRQVKFS